SEVLMRGDRDTKRVPDLELSADEKLKLRELFHRLRLDFERKYPDAYESGTQVRNKLVQEILNELSASERKLLADYFLARNETPSSLPQEGGTENQCITQSLREISSFGHTPPAGATFLLLLAPKT